MTNIVLAVATADSPLGDLLNQMLTAAQGRQWVIVVGTVLSLIVVAIRKFGASQIPWLATDRGGAVMILAVSIIGAIGSALVAGQFTLMSLIDGIIMATNAAGGYALIKKILWPTPTP